MLHAKHFRRALQLAVAGEWGALYREAQGKLFKTFSLPEDRQDRGDRENLDALSWRSFYTKPLIHLGESDNSRLQGIFSPGYVPSIVQQYIHNPLAEYARAYATIYHAPEMTGRNLARAFDSLGWEPERRERLTILDIGVGSGNSTIPLFSLCPASFIIGSDLNVEMLLLLKEGLKEKEHLDRCAFLQLNAEELDFLPETFDLVCGSGVLHHLLDPEKTLEGCARILRPGGAAIFFEPFENGNAILTLAYRTILQDSRQGEITKDVKDLFALLVRDFDERKGRDKSHPRFLAMEDKWLFTPYYWREMAKKYGFADCTIFPLHATEGQFEYQTAENLRLGLGKDKDALPSWAWEIVCQYDTLFSEDMKNELLAEGCMILKN